MALDKYLRGIPLQAQQQALSAAANAIYTQVHHYLKDLHNMPASIQAETLDDIAELRADAQEILDLGVVSGHGHNKLKMITGLDVARELTLIKLAKREQKKLEARQLPPIQH